MKRALGGIPLILALLVLGCGGSSEADSIMKQTVSAMEELCTVIESGKSAKEMKADVETTVTKIKDLKKRADQVKTTKGDADSLKKKYEPQLKKVEERMKTAMEKLTKTDPQAALGLAMSLMEVGK